MIFFPYCDLPAPYGIILAENHPKKYPVSNSLRAPFITSHNIYYVKSHRHIPWLVSISNRLDTCGLECASTRMSTTFQHDISRFSVMESQPRKTPFQLFPGIPETVSTGIESELFCHEFACRNRSVMN